jgi:hypothetical protein
MPNPRVVASPTELESAITVWLKTLPPRVMERYLRFLALRAEKRDTEADRIDPRDELAKHLAAKFAQAGWEASYRPAGSAAEAAMGRDR